MCTVRTGRTSDRSTTTPPPVRLIEALFLTAVHFKMAGTSRSGPQCLGPQIQDLIGKSQGPPANGASLGS